MQKGTEDKCNFCDFAEAAPDGISLKCIKTSNWSCRWISTLYKYSMNTSFCFLSFYRVLISPQMVNNWIEITFLSSYKARIPRCRIKYSIFQLDSISPWCQILNCLQSAELLMTFFCRFAMFWQWWGKYFVQLAALFFSKLLNYIIIHLHFTGTCSSTDNLV